ncbi:hypothetical protein HHK36_007112 [Tetracentron sinense]|uniref:Uncharacterized protein n=1 Tax=Tetracentron sinense TaxID=13715 RepID=A0A835DPU7_TETSI|nr:hypothetical protein HHK36_007112 [Tetracentron sinense]
MASSNLSRWLRPEVYPLFAAVGVAIGICGFQLVRNICFNPEVRSLLFHSLYISSHPFMYVCMYGLSDCRFLLGDLDLGLSTATQLWEGNPKLSDAPEENNLSTARVNKESRAAGVLENFAEGEKCSKLKSMVLVQNASWFLFALLPLLVCDSAGTVLSCDLAGAPKEAHW